MRKVVVSEFMALDGVIQEPLWTFPYWNDEIAKFKYVELFSSDALLLGRVTYDGFAQAWPGRIDEEGYADRINAMPKHVVSTTLQDAAWDNSRIICGNVVEEIARLKQQPGQNILVFGSGRLVETLVLHNLVDQFNLQVYPVVCGTGQRLFTDRMDAKFWLVQAQSLRSGVIILIYQPNRTND